MNKGFLLKTAGTGDWVWLVSFVPPKKTDIQPYHNSLLRTSIEVYYEDAKNLTDADMDKEVEFDLVLADAAHGGRSLNLILARNLRFVLYEK